MRLGVERVQVGCEVEPTKKEKTEKKEKGFVWNVTNKRGKMKRTMYQH